MDTLLTSVLSGRHVAVLSMQGLERSRFFLRLSLVLLAKRPEARIYHVLDKDRLVDRVHLEANSMPFNQFGTEAISITKLDGINPVGHSKLIICSLTHLYQQVLMPSTESGNPDALNVVIFDLPTMESLESTILELKPYTVRDLHANDNLLLDIKQRYDVRSFVLACSGPVDGYESDLGLKFDNIITYNCLQSQQKGFASFVDPCLSLSFDDKDPEKKAQLHVHFGNILAKVASSPSSGRVVVFFPTYGKMVEYHNAWKQSGVFDRIGLTYARENRGGDHFKKALKDLVTQDRSIFLCSIRYHQDEDLAEMVLGQVETFVIVGAPYPIMSETWTQRIKRHDEQSAVQSPSLPTVISGSELYINRAVEFMNEIIKRCLFNGYRSKPCQFLILGVTNMRDIFRHKLVKELGDVQVWQDT